MSKDKKDKKEKKAETASPVESSPSSAEGQDFIKPEQSAPKIDTSK